MGLDVSGHTILGVQVSRNDFWLAYGEEATCSRCGRKAAHPSERFCPSDGREMRVRTIEKPTENFAKYAASINEEPGELWDRIQQAAFCSIWRCDAMQDTENDTYPLALGFRIGETWSNRNGGKNEIVSTDFESCKLLIDQIKEMTAKLGLSGDRLVRIFTCVYLSY